MSYDVINSRRIPYDINGAIVGKGNIPSQGIKYWLNSDEMKKLNEFTSNGYGDNATTTTLWFFFPEKTEVESVVALFTKNMDSWKIEGSNDTTNGVDGTWETATKIYPGFSLDIDAWRKNITTISFSTSCKVIRYSGTVTNYFTPPKIIGLCIYGRKAFGETVDDILITDIDGNELTALMDWGDRPEATEQMKSIKLKNASTTKTANGVNLQLNHADFGMSFNVSGSWTATLDIESILPNSLSEPIYIKNTIGVPPQILGPKSGRMIVAVGSWA